MKADEWISLRHAAELLGVHPATVRNWADKGEIASMRTAGKHRRFKREDIERMVRPSEETSTVEVQLILQSALGSARMQVGDGDLETLKWYGQMSETTRGIMRQQGRAVLEAMRHYLASGAPDVALSEAIRLGKEYAQVLSADGLRLADAMRGFFFFSDFVINSILNWSELATPRNNTEWASLLRLVNTFIHTMLLSISEYYDED